MKKFKLIALSLLAATFGLTSCELPDFIKNIIHGEQVDPTPEPEPQPKPQPQPEVVSVKIRTAVTEVTDETAPFKLVAAVAVKNGASNGVTWSSSNSSVGTVDQNGLFTPIAEGKTTITATSTADSSKKDSVEMTVVAVPGVLSVTIQNAPEKVYLHQAVELEAVVAAKGAVTDAVSWSSSDESIATVDDSGKILFSAEGKVTFTVKSRFDASKSDSVEIEGVDGGLHPELIEEGLTYSKTWPTAALNEYLGEEVFSLEEANGFYIKHNEVKEATEETSATASNFIIISEYNQAYVESFSGAVDSYVGFEDEDNGLFCFVSPNQTHEVDFGVVALDEEGENLLSQIVFYHVDEIWETSENTTDTEWNDEVKEAIEENGVEIPFVTLGEKYDSYVYSDGTVEISDYCADFNKLNGYEEIVLAAGFEKVETTDGSHLFVKNLQYKEIYLGYLFGLYGNTIDAWVELVPLDAYPSEYVDPFIQSIPSKYTLPAFDAGDTYYFNYGKVDLGEDEEDIRDAASVQVVGVKEEDCTAYVGSLIQDGFKEIQSFDKVEGFSGVMLQKGKLVVLAEIEYESRDATEEEIAAFNAITEEEVAAMTDEERADYYTKLLSLLFTGTFPVYEYDSVVAAYLTVCGDPEGMEDPGVYLAGSSATIALEETLQLEPIFFEMEQTAVIYNSSDESIASVSAEGLVTAIAEGDAVITVSAMLGEQEVSDSITIHVVKSTSAIAAFVEEANAIFAEMGAEEELVLPDPEATKVWPEPYSGWDEENQTYYINLQTEMTPEQYISLLSDDYEIGVDEEGDPIATNGIYVVGAYYDSYGDLMIYVYLYEEVPPVEGDTVTFSEMGYENAQDLDGAVYTLGSGATITLSVGEGSTTPKYYSTGAGLRIYQKNTITVVAPEGESLGSIEIEMSQFNKKYSCDVGTIEEGNSSITWTAPEDCSSVTFTIEDGSGHNRVTSITVSLA